MHEGVFWCGSWRGVLIGRLRFLYTGEDVDSFARLVTKTPKDRQDLLHAPLDPVVERFNEVSGDEQSDFRSKLMDYIRQYAFLSQLLPFEDTDLEKLYIFAKFLRRKMPTERNELPFECCKASTSSHIDYGKEVMTKRSPRNTVIPCSTDGRGIWRLPFQ